jgi:putative Ca2+/H+ antiporter (TMEM165/GDT1 family)
MTAFITSVLFVVLAEMGDKTQLLAMCFAMKYRWQTVMWGVFVATLLNHLLAVLTGIFITTLVPMSWIQIAASVSFIIFGLWTIRGDTLGCVNETSNRSPFWVVAIAFFIAECGDKTQLATVALAAQFNTVLPVWLGTTTGMMIADTIGIIFGVVMGRKIPENTVKWFAAVVFIAFGLVGLYETAPHDFWGPPIVIGLMAAIAGAIVVIVCMNRRDRLTKDES